MKRTDHGHSQHWVSGLGWQCDPDCVACAQGTLYGDPVAPKPRFDGAVYEPSRDDARLTGQLKRVFEAMRDGHWRTIDEVSGLTGDPQTSVSCQLRHLRKDRFGAHTVDKRQRGEGLWEYRLEVKA